MKWQKEQQNIVGAIVVVFALVIVAAVVVVIVAVGLPHRTLDSDIESHTSEAGINTYLGQKFLFAAIPQD